MNLFGKAFNIGQRDCGELLVYCSMSFDQEWFEQMLFARRVDAAVEIAS